MHRRSPARFLVHVVITALVLTACGGDDDGEPPRYDDVSALAAELDGVAEGCQLEYEGLVDDQREVSVCTLGTVVAELSVWSDVDALDALIAEAESSGRPLVTGANWSIDVADEDLAAEVAEATGGDLRS